MSREFNSVVRLCCQHSVVNFIHTMHSRRIRTAYMLKLDLPK